MAALAERDAVLRAAEADVRRDELQVVISTATPPHPLPFGGRGLGG